MHNDRDLYDEPGDDDTQTAERQSWERATLPVEAEPDEDGDIEEVEGEEDGDEGESDEGHVEGRELIEADDEEASPLTDEQVAELRELQIAANEESRALGLPNFDIDAYMQALRESGAEDFTLAEEDKPIFSSYFSAARERGASAAEIGRTIGWYLSTRDAATEQRYEADLATRDEMVGALQSKWGGNFKANLNELKYLVRSMGPVGDALQAARMADGTLLINSPGFADVFLQLSKSGARAVPNPKERLEEISDTLRTDPQRYFRENLSEEAIALRRKAEATPQRGPVATSISRQLAEVSKVLRDDPQRYWRENMGDRAIELRRQLQQIKAADAARGR
jgi:hypothetical protein